jgi:hypothetical protein
MKIKKKTDAKGLLYVALVIIGAVIIWVGSPTSKMYESTSGEFGSGEVVLFGLGLLLLSLILAFRRVGAEDNETSPTDLFLPLLSL